MTRILTDENVLAIFRLRMDGKSLRPIALQFGISAQYVMKILNREAYKHVDVTDGLTHVAANHVHLKRAKSRRRDASILVMHEAGLKQVEIAKKLGCGTATVCRVVNGK